TESQRPANTSTRLRLLQYRPLRRGRPAFACCNTVRFGAAGPPSLAAIPSASAWQARLRLLQYRPLRRGRPAFACCNTVRFGLAGPPSLAAIRTLPGAEPPGRMLSIRRRAAKRRGRPQTVPGNEPRGLYKCGSFPGTVYGRTAGRLRRPAPSNRQLCASVSLWPVFVRTLRATDGALPGA